MDKPVVSIQVIDRSARLMEAIAATHGPASLKILSAETGLHPSTAFRILGSLIKVGFVERDSAGEVVAGLSVSAPIERRKDEWVKLLKQAASKISERL